MYDKGYYLEYSYKVTSYRTTQSKTGIPFWNIRTFVKVNSYIITCPIKWNSW
jgi:hypothetical protein